MSFVRPACFLHIDTADLRKRYLKLSRETHPDFHSSSDLEQAAALTVPPASPMPTTCCVMKKTHEVYPHAERFIGTEARAAATGILMEMMDLNEAMAMADGEDEKIHGEADRRHQAGTAGDRNTCPWTPLIRTAMNRN